MIDCPIFFQMPGSVPGTPDPPVDDVISCGGCDCGYLQFEDLMGYLPEIEDNLKQNPDSYTDFEFKLRKSIIEVSRLFDIEAGVQPGYFSKAHYKTTKIFATNGTRYIQLPPFVDNTLEVRTLDDIVVSNTTYAVENSHLVHYPCLKHVNAGCGCSFGLGCGHLCSSGCRRRRAKRFHPWPNGCYKITAKWGFECADVAVQRSVRDFLIESYRLQDPVVTLANGISIQRTFKVPYSWSSYISNFKARRKIFSGYAIA